MNYRRQQTSKGVVKPGQHLPKSDWEHKHDKANKTHRGAGETNIKHMDAELRNYSM